MLTFVHHGNAGHSSIVSVKYGPTRVEKAVSQATVNTIADLPTSLPLRCPDHIVGGEIWPWRKWHGREQIMDNIPNSRRVIGCKSRLWTSAGYSDGWWLTELHARSDGIIKSVPLPASKRVANLSARLGTMVESLPQEKFQELQYSVKKGRKNSYLAFQRSKLKFCFTILRAQ